MTQRKFEVKEVFTHKKRLCVIVEMEGFQNYARQFVEGQQSTNNYCNGYVQVSDKNKGKDYDAFSVKTDELTFSGNLDHLNDSRIPKGTYFFGFDSAHSWNDHQPESKTCEKVKERVIEMANEMVRRRM